MKMWDHRPPAISPPSLLQDQYARVPQPLLIRYFQIPSHSWALFLQYTRGCYKFLVISLDDDSYMCIIIRCEKTAGNQQISRSQNRKYINLQNSLDDLGAFLPSLDLIFSFELLTPISTLQAWSLYRSWQHSKAYNGLFYLPERALGSRDLERGG